MEGDATFSPRGLTSGDFNPRPPWGGRLTRSDSHLHKQYISIHALRGEGDPHPLRPSKCARKISIHALRGEGDIHSATLEDCDYTFQSTPSVGRATISYISLLLVILYFNPRPPWGGRPKRFVILQVLFIISIHALRGEGDIVPKRDLLMRSNFNPRPPWGGRPDTAYPRRQSTSFQSTPSVGRATVKLINKVIDFIISIHALRGEGDCLISFVLAFPQISIHALRGEGDPDIVQCGDAFQINFNPRPPWGGRQYDLLSSDLSMRFQSTPSVGRATQLPTAGHPPHQNFNPRPPWGGRPDRPRGAKAALDNFNPRPPWGGRPWYTSFLR